jgi:hypothetical protein
MRLQASRPHALFFRKRTPTKQRQFALPFPDTTSLGGGLDLDGGIPTARSPALPEMTFQPEAVKVVDTPDPTKSTVPTTSPAIAVSPRAGSCE